MKKKSVQKKPTTNVSQSMEYFHKIFFSRKHLVECMFFVFRTSEIRRLKKSRAELFIVRIFVIHGPFWNFLIIEIALWYIRMMITICSERMLFVDKRRQIHQHALNWQMSTNDNNNLHLFRNSKNDMHTCMYGARMCLCVRAVAQITTKPTAAATSLPMAAIAGLQLNWRHCKVCVC